MTNNSHVRQKRKAKSTSSSFHPLEDGIEIYPYLLWVAYFYILFLSVFFLISIKNHIKNK